MSSQSKSSSSSLIDSANFAESIEDEDEDFDWYFIDASDFQSRDRAYVSGPLLPVVSADIDTGDAGAGDAGAGGSAGATTGVAVLGPAAIMAPAKRALDEVPSGNTSSSSSSPTTTPLGSPIPVSIPKDRNGFSCTKK